MRNHLMPADCPGVTCSIESCLTIGKKKLEIKATLLLQTKTMLFFLASILVNNRRVKFKA